MFCFNKHLTFKNIKKQEDVLTKDLLKAKWMSWLANGCGVFGTGPMTHNCTSPDTTIKMVACLVVRVLYQIEQIQ